MSYEKPSKKNPYQLTIRQHYHSDHCISKFSNKNGLVSVCLLESNSIKLVKPSNNLFCMMRVWDQRAETTYMQKIEKLFHEEIDCIKPYDLRNHRAITEYYFLWLVRFNRNYEKPDEFKLNGIEGDNLSKDDEELLESKGVSFIRSGGNYPERFFHGMLIQRDIDIYSQKHFNLKWGLIETIEGDFLVSDNYPLYMMIPISPRLMFVANCQDCKIGIKEVKELNNDSMKQAKKLYFAKELCKCPV